MDEILKQFDKDFREYINASILYSEVQDVYRPLDFEDEVKWLKEYIIKIAKKENNRIVNIIENQKVIFPEFESDNYDRGGTDFQNNLLNKLK